MKFRILLVFLFTLVFTESRSQNIAMGGASPVSACDGATFTDEGLGAGYPDSARVITICPSTPGDVIQVHFSAFVLQTNLNANNSDYLSVFDGPDTNSPSLGDYTGTQNGLEITATVNNPTGCLTFVFDPNGPDNLGVSPGWEAQIFCTTPCANPTAASAITNPTPDPADNTVSICLNSAVTFSDTGSAAQPGFTIANYVWDFADGTIDTNTTSVMNHTFTQPGEYLVTMTVLDNNGCSNLNVVPMRVLVSTIPHFPDIEQLTTAFCLGEPMIFDAGTVESTTWTALPPQVVSGTTYLADGAGFSFSSALTYDFFDPAQTLTDCTVDLLGISINMEHSFVGDLGISITCPNGTTVDLHTWGSLTNGQGCNLGEAVDNDPGVEPGVGYTYQWTPTATQTWAQALAGGGPSHSYTNAIGTPVTVNYLPAGEYAPSGNLCNLVGCPLNGSWTISITDNLGADNGNIFWWGLDLNPALFPGVTTFTPSYGVHSDSTYWSGNYLSFVDIDHDQVLFEPPGPGAYDLSYFATNDFGCTFDTTITVTLTTPAQVTAGPDIMFACDPIQLQGGIQGIAANNPVSNVYGSYTFCYSNSTDAYMTYAPNNPGDGTMVTISFSAGSTENFFDEFYVYDGPDNTFPILFGPYTGSLAGMSFAATNAQGILTIGVTPDGSQDCAGGGTTEWQYFVSCTSIPEFTYSWSPWTNLSDATSPVPMASGINQQTTYTLTGYPVGHPQCASTDEMVVSIDPLGDPGLDNSIIVCSNETPFQLITEVGGTPAMTGSWLDPTGAALASGTFDPATSVPGDYTYNVGSATCITFSTLTISVPLPTNMTISNDTAICFGQNVNMDLLTLSQGLAPFNYSWTYNGQSVSASPAATLSPLNSGTACLTVTDACSDVNQQCFNVIVEQPIIVDFAADTTAGCFPVSFTLETNVDPSLYTQSLWTLGDGTSISNSDSISYMYPNTGVYDVTLQLTSALGCQSELTRPNYLYSYPQPTAMWYANPQPTDITNTTITFTDASAGDIVSYVWTFTNSNNEVLGSSIEANPVFEFPGGIGGDYPTSLHIEDIHGCVSDFDATVVVQDIFAYYIPNSFTPNNDGVNDYFRFYGSDIDPEHFELIIFNRWGQEVFHTKNPEDVWMGEALNEDPASLYYVNDGYYNWRAIVTSKSTGDRKELSGALHMFR